MAEMWDVAKLDEAEHILSEVVTYIDLNGPTKSEILLRTLYGLVTQPEYLWRFHNTKFEGKENFIEELHIITDLFFTDRQIGAFLLWCQNAGVLFRVIYRRFARRYDIVSAE